MQDIGNSRQEAKIRGLLLYFGECKHHGSRAIRRVSSFQCVECTRVNGRKWRAENPEIAREKRRKWGASNPEKLMLIYAKKRSKRLGVPFALTAMDITIPDTCPVLGIPLAKSTNGSPADNSPSLDRVVCELGYIPGNIVVVSHKANRIKNNATLEDLRRVVRFYEQLTGSEEVQ